MRPLERFVTVDPIQPATDFGPPIRFEWIDLARLVVNPDYQRDINRRGRANIRRIVEGFRWSMFSPVIVAPAGDVFAIIDGQHRATAALMHPGIDRVPCIVIDGDEADQARSFAAINGQVTNVLATQIFHARIAAGDPGAVALADLCEDCGVVLLKQPLGREYRIGETLAVGTLDQCWKAYGTDVLHLVLKLIVETGDGNPGGCRAPVIRGMCFALAGYPDILKIGAGLFDIVDAVPVSALIADAQAKRAAHGGSLWEWVGRLFVGRVEAATGRTFARRAT